MIRSCACLLAAALLVTACTSDEGAKGPTSDPTSTTAVATTAPVTAAPTTSVPATTVPTTLPVATTVVPPPGPLLGIAVPQGRVDAIEAIETSVGSTFHLIRVFTRWEVGIDETDVRELQADGRAIHLSVRPLRDDGTVILWSDIAGAEEGTPLHTEMVEWADAVVSLGPDARFTFNHEPETRESDANGDALEYRAAWRRMVELIRSRGGEDVDMVWTVGAEVLRDPEGHAYYPGDDVVDVIGADLYNWFTCQGTDRPWVSFNELVEPAVAFAAARGKALALPEFASAADPADPTRRAGWMDAAVDVMAEWDPAERQGVELDFVAWFDVTAPGGTNPGCRWSHQTDLETERAFGRMVRDLIGR